MPCQSYDDSWDNGSNERKIRELKKQADMLARIACKALTELEKNSVEDLLLLKDDEVRTWWSKHKEDDAREQARLMEIERRARVREEALARLSDEEKELLGLAPKKPSRANIITTPRESDSWEVNQWETEEGEQMIEEIHKMLNGTVAKTWTKR